MQQDPPRPVCLCLWSPRTHWHAPGLVNGSADSRASAEALQEEAFKLKGECKPQQLYSARISPKGLRAMKLEKSPSRASESENFGRIKTPKTLNPKTSLSTSSSRIRPLVFCSLGSQRCFAFSGFGVPLQLKAIGLQHVTFVCFRYAINVRFAAHRALSIRSNQRSIQAQRKFSWTRLRQMHRLGRNPAPQHGQEARRSTRSCSTAQLDGSIMLF